MRYEFEELEPDTRRRPDYGLILVVLLFVAIAVGSFLASSASGAEPQAPAVLPTTYAELLASVQAGNSHRVVVGTPDRVAVDLKTVYLPSIPGKPDGVYDCRPSTDGTRTPMMSKVDPQPAEVPAVPFRQPPPVVQPALAASLTWGGVTRPEGANTTPTISVIGAGLSSTSYPVGMATGRITTHVLGAATSGGTRGCAVG